MRTPNVGLIMHNAGFLIINISHFVFQWVNGCLNFPIALSYYPHTLVSILVR